MPAEIAPCSMNQAQAQVAQAVGGRTTGVGDWSGESDAWSPKVAG
jgi:hypothetical protein